MTGKKKRKAPDLPPEVVRRRFAIEYVRDFDAEQALARTYGCLVSDFDPQQLEVANFLPSDPYTNDLIEEQLSYMQDRTEVDREFLILKTRQILDQCMKAVPVMEKVRGQYVESGEFQFDSLGAVKCVQTLYEITGIKALGIQPEEDENTGVLLVPEQVHPDNWADMVAGTKSMQERALEKVMGEADEAVKH